MQKTVEIFGKSQCHNCGKAIEVAKWYGKDYEYKNIDYKKYRDELSSRIDIVENTECPYVFVRGEFIGNYEDFADYVEGTMGGFGDQPF